MRQRRSWRKRRRKKSRRRKKPGKNVRSARSSKRKPTAPRKKEMVKWTLEKQEKEETLQKMLEREKQQIQGSKDLMKWRMEMRK
jgi:hypothetical protein